MVRQTGSMPTVCFPAPASPRPRQCLDGPCASHRCPRAPPSPFITAPAGSGCRPTRPCAACRPARRACASNATARAHHPASPATWLAPSARARTSRSTRPAPLRGRFSAPRGLSSPTVGVLPGPSAGPTQGGGNLREWFARPVFACAYCACCTWHRGWAG